MTADAARDEGVQAAADEFLRNVPESFWDVAVWVGNNWLGGALDVADRKRIAAALVAANLTGGEAGALAEVERRMNALRNTHWQRHLAEHPDANGASCPKDYGMHDAYAHALRIVREVAASLPAPTQPTAPDMDSPR